MRDDERKNAIVTGGSKGIGKQIALTLAENGYNIAVNYHNDEKGALEVCEEAKKHGVLAYPLKADVGNYDEISSMFNSVDKLFPHIDLLVNNAGSSSEAYFLKATEKDFDTMTAIDWKGVYFCSQFAAKRMIKKKVNGVIINITSNQVVGCWPRATIYSPSKAAVSKFTKNASMELAPYGIRMLAVAPGYTDVGWPKDDHRFDAAKYLPLKRFASTKEIAEGVLFLASDKVTYMTGSTLTIDGGATLPVTADSETWREEN